MQRRNLMALALAALVAGCGEHQSTPTESNTTPELASQSSNGTIGINVVLKGPATSAQLGQLRSYGTIVDQIVELNAVQLRAKRSALSAIRALPFVAAASPDVERKVPPHVNIPIANFAAGLNTWNLDAINVTDSGPAPARKVSETGQGVYVGVVDTGLLPTWRYYFPAARIATQFAKSFQGGGSESANVSEQPNKWEHDTHGHGTHVTSIIIGFLTGLGPFNGTAPDAKVIPVKVLNQNGSGSSFVVAHGIAYIAGLKGTGGPLHNSPVVINLSLGGPELDPVEQAAIDLAIRNGVILVAAAGNEGAAGMSFPGAYAPVISAAAAGWKSQWTCGGTSVVGTWFFCNVADPTVGSDLFIEDFSSRPLAGQDLDVAAPGSWVLGPFQESNGQPAFFFVSGTSQATAHVTGLVALMAEKKPSLTAAEAESVLENTAVPIPPGSANVFNPLTNALEAVTWGADATGAGFVNAAAALGAL